MEKSALSSYQISLDTILSDSFPSKYPSNAFFVYGNISFGDDTYRLLPYLMEDEEFIEAVEKHPKLFTGFSDTTVNHLMFYKLGLSTYYGPNFICDLGEIANEMLS